MNPSTCEPANRLPLLHLCDSLFPIGGFGHSDGLETAVREMRTPEDLRDWLDLCVDETFGRLDGPAVAQAWDAVGREDWPALVSLDREVTALRPAAATRRATRAMGLRLAATWHALHPHPRLAKILALAERGAIAPTLPVAFGASCACAGIAVREALQGFGYTRLAAGVSAAMRLMPLGQTEAHALLARALERLPPLVETIACSPAPPACFSPLMDIAAMTQQYLDSRLFRS